jgi:exodeoxyribonuclease VII small subunit
VTDPVEKKVPETPKAPKAPGGRDASEPATLEARLRRLEEIMSQLEADEVDVERALALFEEGVRHVRAAEKILSETELRVEELLSSGKTRPLEDGEQAEGRA